MNGRTEAARLAAEHEAKQPVAWAVMRDDWYHGVYLDESPAKTFASRLSETLNHQKATVVPLYREPRTLTPEERMAVAWAVDAASNDEHPAEDILRGLLARCALSTR